MFLYIKKKNVFLSVLFIWELLIENSLLSLSFNEGPKTELEISLKSMKNGK